MRPKPTNIICIVLILCAISLTYANSIYGVFLLDDYAQILNNPYVKNWKNIPAIFSSGFGRLHITGANYYRPLLEFSYMADYFLWAHEKIGYHLTNIFFHAASAAILFLLINALFKDAATAFLTTLLFGVHPIYTSAVTYISGRADSMVILFLLLSLFFYTKYLGCAGNSFKFLLFSCLSFFMALLTKEIALFFLFMLLLHRYYWRWDSAAGEVKSKWSATYAAFSAVIIIYLLIRANAVKNVFASQYNVVAASGMHVRFLTMINVFRSYLGILALPVGLRFERTVPLTASIFDSKVLSSAGILMVILYIFVKRRKERDAVFYGMSWYLINLIPISNIFLPLNAFIAENWIQIPSIGFFLAISAFTVKISKPREEVRLLAALRRLAVPALIGMAIFYSFLTIERNKEYSDTVVFYKSALRHEPKAVKLYNNLGAELENRKEVKEAIGMYKKALEINPGHVTSLNNLASIYSAEGRHDEAISMYAKALEIHKDNHLYLNNLGVAYIRKGDKKNALHCWRKSLSIDPNQPLIREYIELN